MTTTLAQHSFQFLITDTRRAFIGEHGAWRRAKGIAVANLAAIEKAYEEREIEFARIKRGLCDRVDAAESTNGAPVPMRLTCPSCSALHVDEGDFATKPHHTHACQSCGMVWRPAVVNTVGVQFLPGYKGGFKDMPKTDTSLRGFTFGLCPDYEPCTKCGKPLRTHGWVGHNTADHNWTNR